jgi:hypothetical protein
MSQIPKAIYICHSTKEIVEAQSAHKWRALNPAYEVHAAGDEECRTFLKMNYPPVYLQVFDSIPYPPIKSDFWRLCVLLKHGGVYVDADIEPLVPLDDFLEPSATFATCLSEYTVLNPHVLACVPNHPVINDCIDTYLTFYKTKRAPDYWGWSITRIMNTSMQLLRGEIIRKEGLYDEYQFITEVCGSKPEDLYTAFCSYKGVKLLLNRAANYDAEKHVFYTV